MPQSQGVAEALDLELFCRSAIGSSAPTSNAIDPRAAISFARWQTFNLEISPSRWSEWIAVKPRLAAD